MYIRSGDYNFVCAAIRAVGKVVELSRIVYDRHGEKSGDVPKERKTANRIALDCLYGLAVATQNCDSNIVVGECVCVMQNILLILMSNTMTTGGTIHVEDPNDVQGFAMRRIVLLLAHSLSNRVKANSDEGEESDDDEEEKGPSELEKVTTDLPARAVASAVWLLGEWMSSISNSTLSLRSVDSDKKGKIRLEVARLADRAFPELDNAEKQQVIHFSSKMLASSACGTTPLSSTEIAICEHILAMGRVDVNPDIKDRARFETAIIQGTTGLKHDTSATEVLPALGNILTAENTKQILLDKKLAPSFLPIEESNTVNSGKFRFGTLSSLVGHKARDAYLVLPQWSKKNSPTSLRDLTGQVEKSPPLPETVFSEKQSQKTGKSGFYDSDSGSSDSSSSDSSSSYSSSESSSDGQNADSESESDDTTSSSDESNNNLLVPTQQPQLSSADDFQNNLLGFTPMAPSNTQIPTMNLNMNTTASSDDDDSSSDASSTSSSSSDASSYNGDVSSANLLSPTPLPKQEDLLQMGQQANKSSFQGNGSSALDDFRGIVMAPVVNEGSEGLDANVDNHSSSWMQLVRPDLCGGLAVRARYLRGPTKSREVQLAGLNPKDPAVVCVQIQFKNK